MLKNKIELIKNLREKTGLSLIECKNILNESNLDINIALNKCNNYNLNRLKKNSNNITLYSKVISDVSLDNKYGILIKINCETDFSIRSLEFKNFCEKISNFAILNKINNEKELLDNFNKDIINLSSKLNENLNINEIYTMNGEYIYSYTHMNKIGVLVDFSKNSNLDLMKKISMHIIANNPKFIYIKDIPNDLIENEYNVQKEIYKLSNISKEELNSKIENKIKEFMYSITLLEQKFVIDNTITVKYILESNNIYVNKFKLIN